MGRRRRTEYVCPICKDVFTPEAWRFTNKTVNGKVYSSAKYTCGPCEATYMRDWRARRKAK